MDRTPGERKKPMRRRALLLVGTMLAVVVTVSGVAWAMTTTILCPHDPYGRGQRYCVGTDGNDYMIGTDRSDNIDPEKGDDVVRAGRGADDVSTGDSDWFRGEDVYFLGPGDDSVEGHLGSETYHGGYGDDLFYDYKSYTYPDIIRCGPGHDTVYANENLDKVAADCEVVIWEPEPHS
jgi:Ca2+-binding RTX toxin-like protein